MERAQSVFKLVASMRETRSESLDWALWFYWIMATTLGWLAGSLFSSAIPVVISGVAIASFQWSVLYRRIQRAWRWAIYSSLAWFAGYLLLVIFLPQQMNVLLGPFLGGILGVVQWLILRKELKWSAWWIPISMLAWTTGLTVVPGFLTSGSLPGALTGLTLLILFRYSSPEKVS